MKSVSLETRSGDQTPWLQDAVEKASTQRSAPPGLRLNSPGERERHNADGHKSGGQYVAVLFGPQLPLTHKPFQIKWEVYFLKKSSLVFIIASLCILHESAYDYTTQALFYGDYREIWSSDRDKVIHLCLKVPQKCARHSLGRIPGGAYISCLYGQFFLISLLFPVDHFTHTIMYGVTLILLCFQLVYDWSFCFYYLMTYICYSLHRIYFCFDIVAAESVFRGRAIWFSFPSVFIHAFPYRSKRTINNYLYR